MHNMKCRDGTGGFVALLLDLYLGHLLGDFVLQPGWLVAAKRDSLRGLLLHVGIIGACTAAILCAQLSTLWNLVLLAMAAHIAIEVITIRIRAFEKVSGLSVFLVDQGLHITSLVILVAAASRTVDVDSSLTFGYTVGAPVLALLCAVVATAFMGSIVVHEVENVFGPESRRRLILPYDIVRVYGMLERAAALLAAVYLGPAWALLAFVPRAVYLTRVSPDDRTYHALALATGLLMALAGWLFVAIATLALYPI